MPSFIIYFNYFAMTRGLITFEGEAFKWGVTIAQDAHGHHHIESKEDFIIVAIMAIAQLL